MNLSILLGPQNTDVTEIALRNCTNNNMITLPKDPKLREKLFTLSQNTIKINNQEYEFASDLYIDRNTNQVYSEFPYHLEQVQPRTVILIICHYSEMNFMMLEQIRSIMVAYNKNHKIQVQYFIVASRYSDKKDPNKVEQDNDILFVNQRETYFNILNKTLKAMEYVNEVLKIDYDFLIRTNVSTMIHVKQLMKELAKLPKTNISIGGNKMQMNWICPGYGLNDHRYIGRLFVQGTSIIFSKDVCNDIIKNQHKIEKTIVDDISLFMYLANFNPAAYESLQKYSISFYECSENLDELHKIPLNIAFYRNKTEDFRDDDIIRMKYLCNMLKPLNNELVD